jgi:DNA-binding response OmpR family regulator
MSTGSLQRVLIVEDVDEARELLKLQFESHGFQVETAENLWQARLALDRRRPDLLILDEVLPGESVLDFIEETVEKGLDLKMVIVTGVEHPSSDIPKGVLMRLTKPGAKGDSFSRFLKLILDCIKIS